MKKEPIFFQIYKLVMHPLTPTVFIWKACLIYLIFSKQIVTNYQLTTNNCVFNFLVLFLNLLKKKKKKKLFSRKNENQLAFNMIKKLDCYFNHEVIKFRGLIIFSFSGFFFFFFFYFSFFKK